ncbi:hypothetical protein ABT112_29475 [Streptomyces sp. NPDC002055]|uniref:hypothetical protein n=1 Tax=Streptomyces sp. NPDC002055 TaxID=3154534 RepID=UPI00332DB9C6
MSARRPLLTATAAGSMLFALWFVPSANATVEDPGAAPRNRPMTQQVGAPGAPDGSGARPQQLSLADTGSVDTTPYLVGGTLFLGLGAALVSVAARRSRPNMF